MTDAEDTLLDLHAAVDARAASLAERHADRLQCRKGCAGCCVDGLTVFEVEADRIRRHHADLLAHGKPHPSGACAFLSAEGACRVYADRPYVCRTQGLPLRWHDEHEGQTVEFRDICVLNEDGPPIETLPEEACWTIGPVEAKLARLQAERQGGQEPLRRVPLRGLFQAAGG